MIIKLQTIRFRQKCRYNKFVIISSVVVMRINCTYQPADELHVRLHGLGGQAVASERQVLVVCKHNHMVSFIL